MYSLRYFQLGNISQFCDLLYFEIVYIQLSMSVYILHMIFIYSVRYDLKYLIERSFKNFINFCMFSISFFIYQVCI